MPSAHTQEYTHIYQQLRLVDEENCNHTITAIDNLPGLILKDTAVHFNMRLSSQHPC